MTNIDKITALYGLLETYKSDMISCLIAHNDRTAANDTWNADRYFYEANLFGKKYNDVLLAIEKMEE